MISQDQMAQKLLEGVQAGDPAAFELVVSTILEYLLETNPERAIVFLHEQCLKVLADERRLAAWYKPPSDPKRKPRKYVLRN